MREMFLVLGIHGGEIRHIGQKHLKKEKKKPPNPIQLCPQGRKGYIYMYTYRDFDHLIQT